jgi:hypothetical protein
MSGKDRERLIRALYEAADFNAGNDFDAQLTRSEWASLVRLLRKAAASIADCKEQKLREALTTNAERARRILSGLKGRLPIDETDADKTARVQAEDEFVAIYETVAALATPVRPSAETQG